jgi:hypothetical protein
MKRWRFADPATVRATIASQWAPDVAPDARLGDIMLREHQREAAARLRIALDRFGGALLADDVGLGKTYTALAASCAFGNLLIVAPAALLDMWRAALAAAGLRAKLISLESLSRSAPSDTGHTIAIIDEAHHARNRLTQRYARLAELTRSSRVLLLSATPLHNAATDLHTLLGLFLGARAERLTPEQRAACIVRRVHGDVRTARMPHRSAPTWLDVDGSPALLNALVEIPPPCPPRDGGDGGTLVTLSLVRAWASTDAALRSTLRRRLARANALVDALTTGRYPTRAELRAWVVGDDATQLAFPELIVDAVSAEWRGLRDAVNGHTAGLRDALDVLAENGERSDDARCELIRDVRRRHPGERIVVFSHFADSVRAMFDRLRGDGGVAAVTANGAWVAGGPLTRTDALARFTSPANGSRRAEAIEVLITTDLLSEGLNLQTASVVIHLDLPWTAARLTQRVGRVWRMSSPHGRVHEYAMAPPAPAERVLRAIEILRRKAGVASAAFGEAVAPLLVPRDSPSPVVASPVSAVESVRARIRAWDRNDGPEQIPAVLEPPSGEPQVVVSAVRASYSGWLALVIGNDGARLICSSKESPPTTDPAALTAAVRSSEGLACLASPSRVERVLADIASFLDAERAATDAGIGEVGSRTQSAAAARIASVAARAPAHRRTAISRLAVSARRAVDHSRSAGRERLLRALLAVDTHEGPLSGDDEAWLGRVIALDRDAPNVEPKPARANTQLLAVIIFVPHQTATP